MAYLLAIESGVVDIELLFLCKAVINLELSRACIWFECPIPLRSVVG